MALNGANFSMKSSSSSIFMQVVVIKRIRDEKEDLQEEDFQKTALISRHAGHTGQPITLQARDMFPGYPDRFSSPSLFLMIFCCVIMTFSYSTDWLFRMSDQVLTIRI